MANSIAATSELYEKLLEAYKTQDKLSRFERCYQIADQAEYTDIHYVLTMLREVAYTGDVSSVPFEHIERILKVAIALFDRKGAGRRAFLMDILEEARERKRPTQTV